MIKASSLALLALLLAATTSYGAADDNPVAECDRLAANPRDLQRAGPGVERDDLQAHAAIIACRYAVAVEPKTARLAYQLARALDVTGRLDEAAQWYRRAADAGSAVARTSLGNMYETGAGVPRDLEQAAALYRTAIPDDRWSFASLAYLYDEGGLKQDYAEALRLYRQGSAAGDSWADLKLGRLYELGHGVPVDLAAALRWYTRAADGGDADGLLNVGVFYDHGMGVPADPAVAADYYRRALEAGAAIAYYNLGSLYADGRGVPRDPAEAERFWQKGVELDVWQAKNALAYAWAEQNRNLPQALRLVDEALAQQPGNGDAVDTRGWVLFRMGRNKEARVDLERATASDDLFDPAVVHGHLGEVLAALGETDKARAAWETALTLDPDPALAASLREKLGIATP